MKGPPDSDAATLACSALLATSTWLARGGCARICARWARCERRAARASCVDQRLAGSRAHLSGRASVERWPQDGDFVAISMDVMCAAKVVLVSAAGAGRAPMVAKALSGEFGPFDCPAGMVEAAEDTLWFTDKEGVADFEEMDTEEDGAEE